MFDYSTKDISPLSGSVSKEGTGGVSLVDNRSVVQLRRGKRGKTVEDPAVDEKEHEGAQGNIQVKLRKLAEQLVGEEAIKDWFKSPAIDGLCGGWAALHRVAPDKLSEGWELIQEWDEEDGIGVFTAGELRDIVGILVFAYNKMNELEPKAKYGEVPKELAREGTDFTPRKIVKIKSYKVTVGKTGGGRTVLDKILSEAKVKQSGNRCTVHIETEKHHMSLRTRSIGRNVRIVDIVESERRGIVRNPGVHEAYGVLDSGIYLPGMTDYDIDINIYLDK